MAELQDRILRARQAIHTEWNPSRWEARQRAHAARPTATVPMAALGLLALTLVLFLRAQSSAQPTTALSMPPPRLLPLATPTARPSTPARAPTPEPANVSTVVVVPAPTATATPSVPSFERSMAQVDRLRRAGQTASAVTLLQRLLREHPRGPSAQTAWFTLGRMQFDLGDFPSAAQSFAHVASGSPLAEDALAREASAWARAGELPRARARAQRYLQSHPNGAYYHSMRALLARTEPEPATQDLAPQEAQPPRP